MDWKGVGEAIAKIGLPLLGAALPIPGGAAIGTALASAIGAQSADPQEVLNLLTSSADAMAKAKQFELTHEETMLKLQLDKEMADRQADSADLGQVNQTMRSEASSEHWAQWMWRPYNGFAFGTTLFLVYGLPAIINTFAPLFTTGHVWTPVQYQEIPEYVFVAWGAVLGVTAWWRGVMKVSQAGGK